MLSMRLNGVAECGHVVTTSSTGEHAMHGPVASLRLPHDSIEIRLIRPAFLRASSHGAAASNNTRPCRSASPRTKALIRCLDKPRAQRTAPHARAARLVRMCFSRSDLKVGEPAKKEFPRDAELQRDVASRSPRRHQATAIPSSGAFSAGRTRLDNCQGLLDQRRPSPHAAPRRSDTNRLQNAKGGPMPP